MYLWYLCATSFSVSRIAACRCNCTWKSHEWNTPGPRWYPGTDRLSSTPSSPPDFWQIFLLLAYSVIKLAVPSTLLCLAYKSSNNQEISNHRACSLIGSWVGLDLRTWCCRGRPSRSGLAGEFGWLRRWILSRSRNQRCLCLRTRNNYQKCI